MEQKKKYHENKPEKYPLGPCGWEPFLEKNQFSYAILKINGATPQLDQNLKPKRYLIGDILYVYVMDM